MAQVGILFHICRKFSNKCGSRDQMSANLAASSRGYQITEANALRSCEDLFVHPIQVHINRDPDFIDLAFKSVSKLAALPESYC